MSLAAQLAAQLAADRAALAGARSGAEEPAGHPDGVHATARIHATYNGRVTTLPQLRSDGPFHLRRMRTDGNTAKVGIIGAMSAPLGGDRLTIDVTAGDRAVLEVTTAAATLALRGPTTAPATYDVRLTAGEHTSLHWLPQPLISAMRQQPPADLHRRTRRHRTAVAARGAAPGPGQRASGPPHQCGYWSTVPEDHCSTSRRHTGTQNPAGTARPSCTDTALSANSCSSHPKWAFTTAPSSSARAPGTGAPSSHHWPTARHCSPPPSHRPPRPCGNCSTKPSHTPSKSSADDPPPLSGRRTTPAGQPQTSAPRDAKHSLDTQRLGLI